MPVALFFLGIAILSSLFFWNFPTGDARAQQPLGPAAFCGVPTFAAPNPQGASATIWQNTPVIIIDHSQFSNPLWLQFIVGHECGHHVLGHSLPQGMWFRQRTYWATGVQELDADCWSAQTVSRAAAEFAARYFAQVQGQTAGGPGYPTGYQRADRIIACAGL